MYERGMSDAVIADYFRIPTGTVTSYRRKHWENAVPVTGKAHKTEPPKERFTLKGMEPVEPAVIQNTGTDEEAPAQQEETPGAGQYAFNYSAGLQEPADPAAAADPAPAGEKKPVLVEGGTCAPKQKPDIMDILEAATGHLTGMQAVCTAGALQHLMYWRHPEDLLRARDHIDYLLDLLQRTEGR